MNNVILKVKEIKGNRPVFKGGEKIVIEGPEINLKKTDKIGIHALVPMLHYAVTLREGAESRKAWACKRRGEGVCPLCGP